MFLAFILHATLIDSNFISHPPRSFFLMPRYSPRILTGWVNKKLYVSFVKIIGKRNIDRITSQFFVSSFKKKIYPYRYFLFSACLSLINNAKKTNFSATTKSIHPDCLLTTLKIGIVIVLPLIIIGSNTNPFSFTLISFPSIFCSSFHFPRLRVRFPMLICNS